MSSNSLEQYQSEFSDQRYLKRGRLGRDHSPRLSRTSTLEPDHLTRPSRRDDLDSTTDLIDLKSPSRRTRRNSTVNLIDLSLPVRPRAMSTNYNFPPPPPPPGPLPQAYQQQQSPPYSYQHQPQHQQSSRGGSLRGRGGFQGGRGDSHGASPYSQHVNGYSAPQQGGPPQGPPVGYSPHNPAAGVYIGPQAPIPTGPPHQAQQQNAQVYNPQWQQQNGTQQHNQPQHHGPQHLGPQNGPHQPPHMQHPLAPQPLNQANYHPNYAPPAHQPPPQQYGPQQPPQHYAHYQQQPYGQIPAQAPPQQWAGPPQQAHHQFSNRSRGRGGFGAGRGGHDAPLMGPPIRMGFDNGQNHMAQTGAVFPPPQFSNGHSQAMAQSPYQGHPPPNLFQRGPSGWSENSYTRDFGNRGGGNFKGRGRGNFHDGNRGGRKDHHNGNHRSPNATQNPGVSSDVNNSKKKKKRRTNTLGLTPGGTEYYDSEEENADADEEARLVTLLGPDTPQLPSDLASWLEERKSKFPTKARREAAAAAALEEHRKRSERRAEKLKIQQQEKMIKQEGGTDLDKQQREVEKLRQKLAKEEKKMQDAMSGSKRKRDTGDEGDDDRDHKSEGSDDGSSSSDGGPDTMSSHESNVLRVSQPAKAQLQRHCKYFSTGGTCGKKGKCRFVHDQAVRDQALRDKEANGGKMTLAQRLILNDTAKDDLTILKSIKYLKEKGLLAETAGAESDGAIAVKSEDNGYRNMDDAEAT